MRCQPQKAVLAGKILLGHLDDDGTLTISGTGDMYDWGSYTNKPPFYRWSSNIKNLVIQNGVTSIGEKAFYCYDNLKSIEIPNSVTSIGEETFYGCSKLTSIEIPDSVTSIGNRAFEACRNLTGIDIPSSVINIGSRTFSSCGKMTSINVDKDNPKYCSVDGNLFSKDKTELLQYIIGKTEESYIVPNGVTSICDGAFAECESLTSIEMPNGVTSIGEYAFYDCYNLTSVKMPNSVTSIGEAAFWCCGSLTSIKIPSGVKSISDSAFSASGLTSIEIPSGVTGIYFAAFKDCDKLKSIKIPSSVTSIGDFAFDYCISLTDVYYGGTEKQWDKINIVGDYNNSLKNSTIHCLRDLPMTTATITKEETSTAYTFSVEPEEKYEDCYVYAAMYDENGLLKGFNRVPLETSGSTNISVDKTDNDESAKVFILSDMLQPVITTQEFTLE